jgi:hypothetical protein
VRVSSQRVNDEDGVLPGCIELAPGLVGERNLFQVAAEFRLEGAYSMEAFVRSGRGSVSAGPRV